MRDEIEALLRAVRPFELCNNLDVSLRACGNCQGCNLTTAAAAVRAELAREPVELSDEELLSIYCAADPPPHMKMPAGTTYRLRAVARAARGEKP